MNDTRFDRFLREIWSAAGGDPSAASRARMRGLGSLASVFGVSDLAAASAAAAGLAAAELIAARHGDWPAVEVDRRLASLWFASGIAPMGWSLPPAWDSVAGDYPAADGWIRLHTNAPRHRAAALSVLGAAEDRGAVARAVSGWRKADLASAVVAAGGCAAAMNTMAEWAAHPQGAAVAAEPAIRFDPAGSAPPPDWPILRERPLRGVRVLDLTRVLAGPVATRLLAGFGAEVLRIDPPDWDEPGVVPSVMLGKRAARLDLKTAEGRSVFAALLSRADILVHGYRSDALESLGLGADWRRGAQPALIDVALDAYGWTGPWRVRRGFDSLVQMSSGIADAGMRLLGRDKPTPLPVQAIDHACGQAMAAAALRGMVERLATGHGCVARLSLARTAALLVGGGTGEVDPDMIGPEPDAARDLAPEVERTFWGPARRLYPPISVGEAPMRWDIPAGPLGGAAAAWSA